MSKTHSLEEDISRLITERSDALYRLYILKSKSKQMVNLVSKIIDAIDENDYMEIDRLKLLIKIELKDLTKHIEKEESVEEKPN